MVLSDDDAQLIAGIVSGENEAISLFSQRFRSKIEAFARKRRIPAQDCDDVVQEVLADAIRQLQAGRFREGAALSTWLHTIMGGKVADYWRKQMRGQHETQLISLGQVPDSDCRLVTVNNSDAVLGVRQALSRLSSQDQMLLILYEQHGYTLEEIGSLMGLRKSAIGDRLAQAREHFRVAIRDGGNTGNTRRLTD